MGFGRNASACALAAVALSMVLASAHDAAAIDSKTVDSVVDRLSGHAGVVGPLAVFQGGDTTTLAERFTIGIPVGIGVKIRPQLTFDMELVLLISDSKNSLLVDPGVIWNFSGTWSAGLRFAVNTESEAWGFTPLLNRSLVELAKV